MNYIPIIYAYSTLIVRLWYERGINQITGNTFRKEIKYLTIFLSGMITETGECKKKKEKWLD